MLSAGEQNWSLRRNRTGASDGDAPRRDLTTQPMRPRMSPATPPPVSVSTTMRPSRWTRSRSGRRRRAWHRRIARRGLRPSRPGRTAARVEEQQTHGAQQKGAPKVGRSHRRVSLEHGRGLAKPSCEDMRNKCARTLECSRCSLGRLLGGTTTSAFDYAAASSSAADLGQRQPRLELRPWSVQSREGDA